MYGTRSFELVKTLKRSRNLPPFEDDAIREIYTEMEFLNEQNQQDVKTLETSEFPLASLTLRHAALERNKQCVLTYIYNRVMKIQSSRWTHGAVLPPAVKVNMTEQESQFFMGYNKILANFMRSLGTGDGFDLTVGVEPPKNVKTQVKVLEDYDFEDNDKEYNLIKESLVFLPSSLVGGLLRDGIVELANETDK